MEIDFLIAFTSGIVIGASPCILLMLSTFGTSLILIEARRKFIEISIGLLTGMLLAYVGISIAFLYFVEILDFLVYLKYIFAAILIGIGIWQIIESTKEESTIFGTPQKVKAVLKSYIEKNSGSYAFLVGIIFILIKIPCFGGVYLALLYSIRTNPLLYVFIVVYLIGMIIPIILILILLRAGLESKKVNKFRLEHRAKLRALAGAVLIFMALYLLILEDLINAALGI